MPLKYIRSDYSTVPYGFRNIENLKDAILLCCSPLADQLLYLTGRA